MLDVGWTELLVIGVVALLVIGPKDLPEMFRQLGRFTAKMRSMAREFQRAMDEAAKQAGVADVAKDLREATSSKAMGLDAMKSAADKFEKWDPLKNAAKPTSPLPAAGTIKPAGLTPPPMPAALPSVATTTAPGAATTTIAAPNSPATQALYEKQAAKAAAYRDYSAKLKAIEEGAVTTPEAAKPAPKPRAVKAAKPAEPAPGVAEAAAKPARRSPPKKKADPV